MQLPPKGSNPGDELRPKPRAKKPRADPPPKVTRRTTGMPAVHCPNCGQNLEGVPTTKCPECGTEWTLSAAYNTVHRETLSVRDRLVLAFYGAKFAFIAYLFFLLAGWRFWPTPGLRAGYSMYWTGCFTLIGGFFVVLTGNMLWSIIRGEATDTALSLLEWWDNYSNRWNRW